MLERVRAMSPESMVGVACRPLGLLQDCVQEDRLVAFFPEGVVEVVVIMRTWPVQWTDTECLPKHVLVVSSQLVWMPGAA